MSGPPRKPAGGSYRFLAPPGRIRCIGEQLRWPELNPAENTCSRLSLKYGTQMERCGEDSLGVDDRKHATAGEVTRMGNSRREVRTHENR